MAPRGDPKHRKTAKLFVITLLVITWAALTCLGAPEQANGTTTALQSNTTNHEHQSNNSENNSTATSATTSETALLSSDEFVDFTEAPTLLFDGLAASDVENSTSAREPQEATEPSRTTSAPALAKELNSSSDETTPSSAAELSENAEEENDDEPETTKEAFEPPKNVSQYMDYIETLFHDLRHQISDLFEPHLPQLIRTSQMVQLSGSCSHDMLRMALALRQFEPWALRMIDSSGKVPEGIFEGSFTALGSYDECLNTIFGQQQQGKTNEPPTSSQQTNQTQGKYCLVNVSPYLPPKPPADRVEKMFQEEANRRNYSQVSAYFLSNDDPEYIFSSLNKTRPRAHEPST